MKRQVLAPVIAGLVLMAGSATAWAQDAADAVAPLPNPGNTTWMMTATILVLAMIVPGLALFYGGMVRSKNVLSVLMQCLMIAALVMLIWAFWGYTMAFGDGNGSIISGFGKAFLSGVTLDSVVGTFSDEVIPEYVFIAFQMTFACITAALIVGAFAERVKFTALMLFIALWVTAVYFPIAHMVWAPGGLAYEWGALDFAGGTVVHINAGIAGLIGCLVIGKRLGYGRDNMAPHSVPFVMIGAALLWVGWFGFNAGSNLEANGGTGLAFINTFLATAAAAVAWAVVEAVLKQKASLVGAASGIVAGLVAITPAAGFVGPMGGIVLGAVASVVAYFFVAVVKHRFDYDDSLDVFGIHAVAGIIGALGTGILTAPGLGGTGGDDFNVGSQFLIQIQAVALTIVWCGVISFVLYKIVDAVVGLRVSEASEREGLDLSSHGEASYHNS